MAVFVPVSFMGGISGQMYRQFAVCIATSIGLSTVVALTLSPALCAMILKSGEEKTDFEFIQKFENWFNSIRDKYLKTVEYFVRAPKKTMNTLIGIIIGILIMFWLCPTGFLPEEDRGALFAMIQLQDGATLSRTADVVKTISDELVKIPGVVSVMQINGMNGENSAFCILKLEPWSKEKVQNCP